MNMKYLIGICAICCSVTFGAHAFDRIEVKEPTPAVAILSSSTMNLKFNKEVSASVHKVVTHIPFFRVSPEHFHDLFKHGSSLITAIVGIVRSLIRICTEMVAAKS
ncbi:hypothetical protein [Bartonella sp. B41]